MATFAAKVKWFEIPLLISISNNIQATISAFWLVKSMSINPKLVQKSEIECKKVKLSAKKWNWVQNGEI